MGRGTKAYWERIYPMVAANLREFGYPGTTALMVREVHEAMLASMPVPHGWTGRYIRDQLVMASNAFGIARSL